MSATYTQAYTVLAFPINIALLMFPINFTVLAFQINVVITYFLLSNEFKNISHAESNFLGRV